MNGTSLCAIYRTIALFREIPRLVAWLVSQPWMIWLTPERRKSMLFYSAIIASAVAIFSRNANWRDYRAALPWLEHGLAFMFLLGLLYVHYFAAVLFKQLPASVRRRPRICFHLLFCMPLVFLSFILERSGVAFALSLMSRRFSE